MRWEQRGVKSSSREARKNFTEEGRLTQDPVKRKALWVERTAGAKPQMHES